MRVANGRYNEAPVQQGYKAVKRRTNRLQRLIASQMTTVEMGAGGTASNTSRRTRASDGLFVAGVYGTRWCSLACEDAVVI